jgi:hypothetical protein
MTDLFQNGLRRCCPDEGLGIFIVLTNVLVDGSDEFWNASEGYCGGYACPSILDTNAAPD